jgi:hypothetical protein
MNSTDGAGARIESSHQRMSMLRILHASCATALDVFRAARNPLDTQLVSDLEQMVERTIVALRMASIGVIPDATYNSISLNTL